MMFNLSNENRADLILALKDAQSELCVGPNFPQGTALHIRWTTLIERLSADVGDEEMP